MSRGGCQALPNGNILIADTNSGRSFEITPSGKIVWEFYSDFSEEEKGEKKRGAIY